MDAIEIIEQLQQNGYRAKVSVVIEMIPEDVAPPVTPPPAPPEPPVTPPPAPGEPTRIVFVTAGVANARYTTADNSATPPRPIMRMYPSDSRDDQGKRVQFGNGESVLIYSKRIDADGSEYYYKIVPNQYNSDLVKVDLYLRESDIDV